MKKICLIFAFVLAMVAVTSCHSNTPESVAKRAMQADKDGDFDTLVDLMGDHNGNAFSKETSEQIKASYKEKGKLRSKEDNIKNFKMTGQEESQDMIVFKFFVEHNDGFKEDSYIQVKQGDDGIWRIPLMQY